MSTLLEDHGCQLFPAALVDELGHLESLLADHDHGNAGARISENADLARWLDSGGPLHPILAELSPDGCRPVRAILFDKNPEQNWALGWHQDRTICVRKRVDVPGFGPYSTKHGLIHVEPPFSLIEAMRTIRIHLDDVDSDNAPLKVALGSHRLGRIPAKDVALEAERLEVLHCFSARGDVWAYATSILHGSDRCSSGSRRRVLQVDYSNQLLPGGLEWLGVGG